MGDILLRAVVFGGRVAVAIVVVRVDGVANLAVFVVLGLSVFGGDVVLIVQECPYQMFPLVRKMLATSAHCSPPQ